MPIAGPEVANELEKICKVSGDCEKLIKFLDDLHLFRIEYYTYKSIDKKM